MRYPQIVVIANDPWLAKQVQRLAQENSWLVREARHPQSCLALIDEPRISLVLLQLADHLPASFQLIVDVHRTNPATPIVVVCDQKMESATQREQLTCLAFDLGASYVLFPPLQQPVIEDISAGLMNAAIQRAIPVQADPELFDD